MGNVLAGLLKFEAKKFVRKWIVCLIVSRAFSPKTTSLQILESYLQVLFTKPIWNNFNFLCWKHLAHIQPQTPAFVAVTCTSFSLLSSHIARWRDWNKISIKLVIKNPPKKQEKCCCQFGLQWWCWAKVSINTKNIYCKWLVRYLMEHCSLKSKDRVQKFISLLWKRDISRDLFFWKVSLKFLGVINQSGSTRMFRKSYNIFCWPHLINAIQINLIF